VRIVAASDELPHGASDHHPIGEVMQMAMVVAWRIQQHFATRAAEFDLSATQAKVLLSLRPEERLPMKRVAERIPYDASNLTDFVDKLEARGVLMRLPDASDRRVKALALTEEGLRLREEFWDRLVTDAGPLASLSDAQVQELRNLFHLILAID
jgi:DNA-binding MarR family transcriptional regulator